MAVKVAGMRVRPRMVKNVYRVVKTGKITPGRAEYIVRNGAKYVQADVRKNYRNPVAKRQG